MNPWPFVIAAYAVAIALTAALLAVGVRLDAPRRSGGRRAQAQMKPKNQRLVLVIAAIVAVLVAVLLAMWGLQGPRVLFLHAGGHRRGQGRARARRCGSAGWSRRARSSAQADGVTIRFVVTDGKARTPVVYRGIVPDLFREGSGAVAEGRHASAARSSPTRSSPSMTSATCRPSSATLPRSTRPGRRWSNDRRSRPCGAVARGRARRLPVGADDARVARRGRGRARDARGRGGPGRADADRVRRAAAGLRAQRHVGRAGVREQPQRQAVHLQGRRRVGEPRRLDADVGDGPRRRRRVPRAVLAADRRADADRRARQPGGAGARLLRVPADRLEPVRAARSRRRPKGRGSTRCCRTRAWPSIRRRSTSAMSGCRSPSASRSARCSPAKSTPRSPGRCGRGCSAPGSS